MKHVYYQGDNVTLRGAFEIDNVAQTPDSGSALIRIMEQGRNAAYLVETAATISGTQLYHKISALRSGVFRAFFTATYNTAADKRTGIIDFVVRKKVAS